MAKAATKTSVKPAKKNVKPSRPAVVVKLTKAVNAAALGKKPTAVKAPVVSKDELRAQLEKAQTKIISLRTKSRDATRATKAAMAQITELEAKVAQLEKKASAEDKLASPKPTPEKPAKPRGRKPATKAESDSPTEPTATILPDSDTSED